MLFLKKGKSGGIFMYSHQIGFLVEGEREWFGLVLVFFFSSSP